MFDDLKQDNKQTAPTPDPQNLASDSVDKTQMSSPSSLVKPSGINDMFGDVDPLASEHGPVDANKPSAIQSGKIKPVSQTTVPNVAASPVPTPQAVATPNIPSVDNTMIVESKSGLMRKIIIAILVIFMLAIVGGGVYYFFLRTDGVEENINQNTNTIVNEEIEEIVDEEIDEPIIDEAFLDDDFDGLNNSLEKSYGTNPFEADSDNDGVFDQDEVEVYYTDPLVDDSDSDGLSDYDEIFKYKTDPNDPDSDGDNFLDGAEVANGYDPLGSGKLEETLDEDNLNTNESL